LTGSSNIGKSQTNHIMEGKDVLLKCIIVRLPRQNWKLGDLPRNEKIYIYPHFL